MSTFQSHLQAELRSVYIYCNAVNDVIIVYGIYYFLFN